MITVKPIKTNDASLLPGSIRVAAEIHHSWFQKEILWFDLPQTQTKELDHSGNCWLMALLPLAFATGETLQIRAPVDAILMANAEKIQQIWTQWFPLRKPIPIKADTTRTTPANRGKTGLFFTGGVDSFFSLLHFDEFAGARKIDDLIYIRGFDIPLTNPVALERKTGALQKIADRLGKNLVVLATNLRQTRLKTLNWGIAMHGAALCAIGLLPGKGYERILVSSSHNRSNHDPWGTHPLTTPLMSSTQTEMVEYGAEPYRHEKTGFIAKSDVAMEHLHVCWQENSEKNCGRCEKCYRTLLALELFGARARATSLPQDGFSLERVKDIKLISGKSRPMFEELQIAARQMSRPDVLATIDACLAANPL